MYPNNITDYEGWWIPVVKRAICIYPALRDRRLEGPRTRTIGNYSGMPRGPRYLRGVEDAALHPVLSPREEQIVTAVETAVEECMRSACGVDAYNMCARLYWNTDKPVTLYHLADEMNVSVRTIQRLRDRFIALVAQKLGYPAA